MLFCSSILPSNTRGFQLTIHYSQPSKEFSILCHLGSTPILMKNWILMHLLFPSGEKRQPNIVTDFIEEEAE